MIAIATISDEMISSYVNVTNEKSVYNSHLMECRGVPKDSESILPLRGIESALLFVSKTVPE